MALRCTHGVGEAGDRRVFLPELASVQAEVAFLLQHQW